MCKIIGMGNDVVEVLLKGVGEEWHKTVPKPSDEMKVGG